MIIIMKMITIIIIIGPLVDCEKQYNDDDIKRLKVEGWRRLEVKLPALLEIMTDPQTSRPTDLPTDRRTDRVIGKLYSQ